MIQLRLLLLLWSSKIRSARGNLKRLPLTEILLVLSYVEVYARFSGLEGEKVPIKMVKMKDSTPTGGEESVRSMAENNDGGHKCAVVKEVGIL